MRLLRPDFFSSSNCEISLSAMCVLFIHFWHLDDFSALQGSRQQKETDCVLAFNKDPRRVKSSPPQTHFKLYFWSESSTSIVECSSLSGSSTFSSGSKRTSKMLTTITVKQHCLPDSSGCCLDFKGFESNIISCILFRLPPPPNECC